MGGTELQNKAEEGLDPQADSTTVLDENDDFGDYLGKFAVEGRRTSEDAHSSMTPTGQPYNTFENASSLEGST